VNLAPVARCLSAVVLGVGFFAVLGYLAYALDRVFTMPGRISFVLDMIVGFRGLIDDHLRFDAVRAFLFFVPSATVGFVLGASTLLVASDGRRKATPWAAMDGTVAEAGSAAVLVLGVGLVAVGVAAPVASPGWLVKLSPAQAS
jgi:hypothetical protein